MVERHAERGHHRAERDPDGAGADLRRELRRGVLAALAIGAVSACSSPVASSACTAPSPAASATCAPASVVVAASDSDYTSSEVGLLALDGGARFFAGGSSFSGDSALASSRGRLFWINRTGATQAAGHIYELDPRCPSVSLSSFSANESDASGNTNPQDVAVAPNGDLWIARFYTTTILVKSSDGCTNESTIDLSMVTGAYRNPYMSSIRIIDGANGTSKAYVALEMLTEVPSGPDAGLASIDPSYIVRIDVATRAIDDMLRLKGRNPFGLMVEYGNALYLADAGDTAITTETDAGIERVDLDTFTSELITHENDIGASVDQLSIQSSGCGTAIVMGPGPVNVTSMISFDPTSGAIITPLSKQFLYTDAGFELAGMAWLDGGVNLVGDRTSGARGYPVHVVSASSTCELTERPLSLFAPEGPIALQAIP